MTTTRVWITIAVVTLAAIVAVFLLVRPANDVATFGEVHARWQPSEGYLLDRNGILIGSARLDYRVRRFDWIGLDAMSPALLDAIVDGEDRSFWDHHGIDWRAAIGALRGNLTGARRRGASTITMQLAALIDRSLTGDQHGRSGLQKLAQVRAARGIEARWRKTEILEAYLNLLGFRGELEGIDAAARLLAGRMPSGLTAPESLLLAALLPAPGATRDHVVARACARAQAKQLPIDCAAIAAVGAGMFARASQLPGAVNLAPDLAHALLRQPGQHLTTTLDANTQTMAREVMARHVNSLALHNVRDGAALVVDNSTGDVLAYVGSAGAKSRARYVDGVRAQRQAGSTLKPFLYGLALEKRYLTNASLLDDSAINLDTATGVYLPQNYDRDFKGLVSVRTALGSSLNVPAVRTLMLVGVDAFRDRLHDLGYAGITRDGEFYGYSLALGSAEVNLWEQASAYRILARGGTGSRLRLLANEPRQASAPIIGPDASFLIGDILSDRAARVATFGLDNNLNTGFWSAVKTGTSKDMRDNWCIGYSADYTVAVWVGNFEGDSMRDVSGVTGAAPAWHDIMVRLHSQRASLPPQPPPGVVSVAITFTPPVETPRREWFAAGTELARVTTLPEQVVRTHIASPGNGLIIAIDPDIPADRQRVPVLARGRTQQLEFRMDGQRLGAADSQLLWSPRSGSHRLMLVNTSGGVVDQVLFTVR